MKEAERYENIKKFAADMAEKHEAFTKQYAKAEAEYPLVALALTMQQAAIAELSSETANECVAVSLIDALTTGNTIQEGEIRQSICLNDLDRCLGRSQGYQEGSSCFQGYNDCRNNPPRKPV